MIDNQPRPLTDFIPIEPFRRPNIVMVVLDCVGEAALAELENGAGGPCAPAGLKNQFVRFRRSVSSASWTLPSHASLLTGLAPWEHGVHGRGTLRLPPGVPTLAEDLRRQGYATACISSNGFLNQASGLTRGFQESHIGSWSETVSRVGRKDRSPVHFEDPPKETPSEPKPEATELSSLIRRFLMHYPGWLDSSSRVVHKMAFPDQPFSLQVSPWIEPTFRRWVGTVDRDRPLFCLFNYLDAHEPYFYDGRAVRSSTGWLRYSRISQDQTDYLIHTERTLRTNVQTLRKLYLGRVQYLLDRLGLMIQILEESHRWEETLLIVTSDHGQAFGSGGAMFHGLSIDDSVTRVPLWVRFPGGRSGGTSSDTWTSALDVAATVKACAQPGATSRPQPDPSPATGARSVACVSDGVVNLSIMARFPESTQARLDHVLLALYAQDQKLEYDACHGRFIDPSKVGPTKSSAPDRPRDQGLEGNLESWARDIGSKMLQSNSPRVDHLDAWGY